MKIRFYNTLTHGVEEFQPVDPPNVYMYNCGLTVYDYGHIGNFRTFLFADVLRRFLELVGYDVHQVMNITDVGHMTEDQLADGGGEDKMRLGARRLREAKQKGKVPADAVDNPDDPYQIAQYYTSAFLDDARLLGLKIVDEYPKQMPCATQHVEDMQEMIQALVANGHAYVASDGAVYYSVESFPAYGKLSGNTLDQLRGGAGGRVADEHQNQKRHPGDFLLWKPDASHIMKWDSPWGVGYPGWHIECSAMARAVLGRDVIDIHTGGEDNIFPHHECEIAQSCGATGQDHFARFWMHARHLLVNGEKMSKSKGNFYTVREVMEGEATGRKVHPAIIRYALLGYYRSNMNFTFKGLQDSAFAVAELRKFHMQLEQAAGGKEADVDLTHPVLKAFAEALADDLNMSAATAVVFEWIRKPKGKAAMNLAVLRKIDSVLNVLGDKGHLVSGPLDEAELDMKIAAINSARNQKNYEQADREKLALRELDYDVMDTVRGTTAVPKPIVVAPEKLR